MAKIFGPLKPSWASGYDLEAFGRDMLAGAVLSVLLIPQAMAYATLAGLSPSAGLLTAMVAPLVYAVLGRVAAVSMGPVALASLLVAEAVSAQSVAPSTAAAIVALEAGAMLALLGIARMGRLVNFVSEPALLGFTAAAAVLIAASQIAGLLGVSAPRAGTLQGAVAGLLEGDGIAPGSAILGLAALLAFFVGERGVRRVAHSAGLRGTARLAAVKSTQLLVILAATLIAWLWLPEVARVPQPEGAVPGIVIPVAPLSVWLALLLPSLTVAVVVFVVGIAVAKSISSRRREALKSDREAIAMGAANLAVGVTGGYAAGVSLSRSALVDDVGARTPLSSAIGALILLPVTLFAAPLLAMMPLPALAALVISAIVGLVKPREIRAVFAHSRLEGTVIVVTFVATLALGVQFGLLAGACAGIAGFLWSSSLPRITREGSDPEAGEGIWRSVERDQVDGDTGPILALRIDRPLYFGNVGHAEDQVSAMVAAHPEARCLILDMRAVTDVDATGLRMLTRLLDNIEETELEVVFASLQREVREALADQKHVARCEHFDTVGRAVATIGPRYDDGDGAAERRSPKVSAI